MKINKHKNHADDKKNPFTEYRPAVTEYISTFYSNVKK